MSTNDTKRINRQEIFKSAHFKARLTVINTRCTAYARTYAQAFAEALRFEYSKVREATQRQAMRNEQDAAATPIQPIHRRSYFIGGNRQTLAIGA